MAATNSFAISLFLILFFFQSLSVKIQTLKRAYSKNYIDLNQFFLDKKNSNEITSENLQKICHFISINLHQRKFEKRIIHQKWMWPKNKIKCAFFCLFAKFFLKVLCALTFAHIGRNQNQTDFWAPPYWSIWNWKKLKPKTKV